MSRFTAEVSRKTGQTGRDSLARAIGKSGRVPSRFPSRHRPRLCPVLSVPRIAASAKCAECAECRTWRAVSTWRTTTGNSGVAPWRRANVQEGLGITGPAFAPPAPSSRDGGVFGDRGRMAGSRFLQRGRRRGGEATAKPGQ